MPKPAFDGIKQLAILMIATNCSIYSQELVNRAAPKGGAGPSADGGTASGEKGGRGGVSAQGGAAGNNTTSGGTSPAGTSGSGGMVLGSGGGGSDSVLMASGGEGGADGDACPQDPDKEAPGECGCGVPETCTELEVGLVHRYDFSKAGAVAIDTIGDANGPIVGVSAADGKVTFDGSTVAYVDLPNGIISSLHDASFEVWLEWGGGSPWQRIFDFGVSAKGEGKQDYSAPTYIYLSPSDGLTGNALKAAFSSNGLSSEIAARASAPLPVGSMQHLVLVVDDTQDQLRLYLNGSLAVETAFAGSLSSLTDVNNWLGRSNFVDGPLKGSIEEFRIYGIALVASQVAASNGFGPNPGFL